MYTGERFKCGVVLIGVSYSHLDLIRDWPLITGGGGGGGVQNDKISGPNFCVPPFLLKVGNLLWPPFL